MSKPKSIKCFKNSIFELSKRLEYSNGNKIFEENELFNYLAVQTNGE